MRGYSTSLYTLFNSIGVELMNILIISTLYPEPLGNGVIQDTSAIHYFAKKWAEEGHRVVVLHPYRNPLTNIHRLLRIKALGLTHSKIDGVNVIFGSTQLLIPHNYVPFKYQQSVLANKMKRYLSMAVPGFKADIVAVHFPMTNYFFAKTFIDQKQSATCVFHSSDISLLNKMDSKKRRLIIDDLKQTYKNRGTRSHSILKQARELGICDDKSQVILSGISEDLIANAEYISRKNFSKLNDTLRIVYAGKLVKRKGVDLVLKAIGYLKESVSIQFDIVGDGPEKEELIKLANILDISDSVKFYGSVERTHVVEVIRQSDVFVMISNNETFGLVYLEAMAQGLITIGSIGEGIDGTIINGNNGFLVSPEDESELCECLKYIQSLPKEELSRISRNAYFTAMNMTDSKMASQYLSYINS